MMESSILGLQQHSVADFDKLYHDYHARLYFYVLKHTQSAFLAEETVQVTFIKIWENADKLNAGLPLSIQVFRIAKNTMIDLIRKDSVRRNYTSLFAGTKNEQQAPADLDNKEELARVHQAIENMAPVRKKVFRLSRIEGHSHYKIAQQLSISPKTVENHIAKALRQLRQTLTSFMFL
jgi:RNA polymerase sigma-70 factor (family 1)